MNRNLRFWTYLPSYYGFGYETGGMVKITLKPGQTLHHGQFQWTDEGWRAHGESWEHTDDGVIFETVDDGRDCDGRLRTGATYFCPANELNAYPSAHDEEFPVPNWQRVELEVYDENARAAGF